MIEDTVNAIKGNPELARFKFHINNKWINEGYENIRVNFKVKTDAENVERLKALSKLSSVFDVTSHGTNVTVQIEKK